MLSQNHIRSLEPLRGTPLKSLHIEHNPLGPDELQPLVGMRLEKPRAARCGLSSLDVLGGMPIAELAVSSNEIEDLSPLHNMPLERLLAEDNIIADREERDFVNTLVPSQTGIWLGLHRTDSRLEWITGEPLHYTNFSDRPSTLEGSHFYQLKGSYLDETAGSWLTPESDSTQARLIVEWDE